MPTLIYRETPEYSTLKCPNPKCDNRTEFIEDAYTETTQQFSIDPDDPGLQPGWDTFDYTTHHAYAIRCGACDAVVWQAPAPSQWFEVRSLNQYADEWFTSELTGARNSFPSEEDARQAISDTQDDGGEDVFAGVTFSINRLTEEKVGEVTISAPPPDPNSTPSG